MNRVVYLVYYFKKLDWNKFNKFIKHVNYHHKLSKLNLWKEAILSSLKYNISLTEYFLYRFYELSEEEKKTFAGTGYMYEYQKLMNPAPSRYLLEDKLVFLKEYKEFVNHGFVSLKDIDDEESFNKLLKNPSGKLVFKDSKGQCGNGIEIYSVNEFSKREIIQRLKETGNDFIEAFIEQHDNLKELSPSGLNTVRIITQLNKNDEVEILGARLRITINSSVDNLAAGNIAASINLETGVIGSEAVYSDITKEPETQHPITNTEIIGFKIPYWQESLDMVKRAALFHKENRSIGWDVAITNQGPELLEGNHDWCKLLWQLPVKKGLKQKLERHKQEYLKK